MSYDLNRTRNHKFRIETQRILLKFLSFNPKLMTPYPIEVVRPPTRGLEENVQFIYRVFYVKGSHRQSIVPIHEFNRRVLTDLGIVLTL